MPRVTQPDTTYRYSPDRLLERIVRPDGIEVAIDYDDEKRLDLVSFAATSVDFNYYQDDETCFGCAPGRIKEVLGPYANDVTFTHDGPLPLGEEWSGNINGAVFHDYDDRFLVSSQTVDITEGQFTTVFGYDDDGLVTCADPTSCATPGAQALLINRILATGQIQTVDQGTLTESLSYNDFGELSTQLLTDGSSTLLDIDYTSIERDSRGRITQKTETVQGTTTVYDYGYDPQGRLQDVWEDGLNSEHYDYDPNGNRDGAIVDGEAITATHDAQDRLLGYGALQFTYGANGELETRTDTTGGETTSYEYDALGNLLSVTLPDSTVISYEVDGLGRRVGRRVDGVLTHQWLYQDALNPVAELDGNGNLVSRFVYATKPNVPDYMLQGANTYRIVSDQLGSVRLVVNIADSNDVLFAANYSAFGTQEVMTGVSQVVPFGFAGGMFDKATGLVRFGARDYEPSVGRWVNKDPILFDGGQPNLYVYANNDAVDRVDVPGTGPILCVAAIVTCVSVGVYEAYTTAKAVWDCMNHPEPGAKQDQCGGGPPPSSPDHDLANQAIECLKGVAPGLIRAPAEVLVCAGLVGAACTAPSP